MLVNPIIIQKLRYFSALLFLVFFYHSGKAQCIFNLNDTIVADADFYIQGSVSGLVNNDLASNQSLCGVTLQFRHQFIGNLEIELISPAGQKILLVGPPLAGTLTTGSLWDISFVRCVDMPSPDGMIPPKFDNGSPWAIGASYTGSYYPYSGCLEDFNVGSANGIWQLHIINGNFYEGNLIDFSLIFCDPTGADCNPCKANSGHFIQNDLMFCQNDAALLTFQPTVDYMPDGQDVALYNYDFVVTINDLILQIGANIDWAMLTPGEYWVYNVAYLKEYETVVKSYIGDPINVLQAKINTTQICAGLTDNYLRLFIHRSYINPAREVLLCSGDSLLVSGKTYKSTTFIRDTLHTVFGCDSIININLKFTDIHIDIEADTIDCNNFISSIDTSGFRMDIPGGLVLGYEWRDNAGNFISNSGGIKVNAPGLYYLYMNILYGNLQCEYLIPKKVESQVFPPEKPTLLPFSPCSDYTVKVLLSPDTLRDVAHWTITGTSDFRRIRDTLYVTWHQSGTFNVCVWASNECGISDTLCQNVIVGQKPIFDIVADSITCNGFFQIEVQSQASQLSWSDLQGDSVINPNADGSLVTGNIVTGSNSAVLRYSGSIDGCDLFGSVNILKKDQAQFLISDTAFCGDGRYQLPVNIKNHHGDLYFSYNGQSFQVSVLEGINYIDLDFNSNGEVYFDSLKTIYKTCNDLDRDTLRVRIEHTPLSSLQDTIVLCNTFNKDGLPKYFLSDLIISGEKSGTWNLSNIPGVIVTNDSIDLSNVPVGVFKVNFKTNTAILPCIDKTFASVIKVVDCGCPKPALNGLKDIYRVCSNYGSFDLDSVASPVVAVQWYDVTAGNKVNIGNHTLNLDDQFVGNHKLMIETVADWEGACADTSIFELIVVRQFHAGDDYLMDICKGESYTIDLDTLLVNSLDDGIWRARKPNYPGFSTAFDPSTNILGTESLIPGNYILDKIVFGNFVCPSDTAQLMVNVFALPSISVSGADYLDCITQEGIINIDPGLSKDIMTEWIYNNAIIHTSVEHDSLIVKDAGIYYFASVNQITGCRDTVSFVVDDNSKPIDSVDYRIMGGCEGTGAVLTLDIPFGGTPPFRYSLDNGTPTTYTQFYGLQSGVHQILIQDAKECRFLVDFNVDGSSTEGLNLGRDTTIRLGNSVWVDIPFPEELIERMEVKFNGVPVNFDPKGEWLRPDETIVVQVLIRDKNGCQYEARRIIYVESDAEIIVPNAFSPNGDGKNDVFFVPSNPGIELILEMIIYDRWGNQVFGIRNIPSGEESMGWDGTFQGRKMNPGVFVYYIRYKAVDGKEALRKGDFTLIR